MTEVTIKYLEHGFPFQATEGSSLKGRFLLDSAQEAQLSTLQEQEPEDWHLDSAGERLPPDRLFQLSPWSLQTSTGDVKLLCRWLNIKTGEAMFQVSSEYGGELFAWLRDPRGTGADTST